VEVPPVVGLLAVVAGGLLLGVPGIIFATPLAVVILSLVKQLYVEDTLESPPAAATVAVAPQ
jgi:predicted PurR-regulated permease PerM